VEAPLDSCDAIDASVAFTTKHPPFEVYQIKEKFGALRFYTNSRSRAIRDLIQQSQEQSFHICDICGQAGTLRKGSWWRTRCDEHTETRQRY
jgi:hypothetical protein